MLLFLETSRRAKENQKSPKNHLEIRENSCLFPLCKICQLKNQGSVSLLDYMIETNFAHPPTNFLPTTKKSMGSRDSN
eukprot:c32814_g1_i1 orf=3-233(-)